MNPKQFNYQGTYLLVLGIILSLLALASPAAARNPNLSNWTINLSGDEPAGETWNEQSQEIEVVGNTVHVTYWAEGPSWRLYYRRSTDGGQTWQPKILLYDTNPGGSSASRERGWKFMAVDGDSVHVAFAAYHSEIPSFNNCILTYRRSIDNGASFEDARALAPASGGYWWIGPTRIAANDGKVTIAMSFQAADGGAWQILTTLNSADGGGTFTTADVVGSGDRYYGVPVGDLKRVGNRVYLLYRHLVGGWPNNNDILYCAASSDGGANYTITRMTTPAADGYYRTSDVQEASYSPNIAVDADNVHVVWTQEETGAYYTNLSLYIRRSTDQGQTFGDPTKLAQNQTGGIGDMRGGQETVAANGGYVYVVFMTSDGTVYLRRSTDSGAGFFPLQTMGTGAWWPNMVVDPANGAKVHVFWWYTYRYSADGGANFTNAVVVMPWVDNFGGSTGVQMALGPGDTKHFTVPLVFCTTAYGWGDRDIFYRRLDPTPAPTASNQAFHTYSNGDEARFDCMEVAGSNWLNFTSQMSGEVWVKPFAGGKNTGYTDDRKYVFCKVLNDAIPWSDKAYTLGTYVWGLPHEPQRQAVAEIWTDDGYFPLSAGAWNPIGLVADNTWTHLAFTYDAGAAGNNFKLYKNGQLIAETRATGNILTGPGNFYAGAYGRWDMSELRLWSKTLSQNEIIANMRRSLTGTVFGLNACYQFGKTTQDQTGHGNDGILIYQETFVNSTMGASSLPALNSLLLN